MRLGSRTIYSFLVSFTLSAAVLLSAAGCDDGDSSSDDRRAAGGRAGAENGSGTSVGGVRQSATNAGGRAGAENGSGTSVGGVGQSATNAGGGVGAAANGNEASAGGVRHGASSEASAGGFAGVGSAGDGAAGSGKKSGSSDVGVAGGIGTGGGGGIGGSTAGVAGASHAETLNGIWRTEGYGYVAELGTDTRLYELSAVSCIDATENPFIPEADELLGNAKLVAPNRILFPSPDRTSPLTGVRVDALPERCKNGGTPVLGDDAYQRSPAAVFDVLWNTFNEQYAFFQTRGVDWTALRDSYRAKISNTTSDAELFELLVMLIRELGDGHVNIGDLESGVIVNAAPVPEEHQAFYQSYQAQTEVADWSTYLSNALNRKLDIIKDNYLGATQQGAANGALRWGRLNATTGYLGIDTMSGYATEATASLELELQTLNTILDEAFGALSEMKDLVIDVRFNGGGHDQASLAILSRLTKNPLDVFIKQARNGSSWTAPYTARIEPSTRKGHSDGRLIVLTSALTASAAEIFTMGTLGIPGLVRIGEATAGEFSDVLVRVLPNRWLFTLSNERYTDPHGYCYEGEGIPVHEQVGLLLVSDLRQGKDSALDAALRTLNP